jgi:exodeoxyribonuclease V beta subunit
VSRVIKEMAFMYPIPEAHHPTLSQWGRRLQQTPQPIRIERGFIKGFIDLIFEHEGRVYLADWKSDALLQYGPQDLSAHVQAHYGWQAKLYTLALTRWLRAFDRETYDARFGGVLYLFLRGLAACPADGFVREGLHFERPSWHQVIGFEQDLRGGQVPVC